MAFRHVHLCLPELPSEDILALAQAIKGALAPKYLIHIHLDDEDGCDDITPVDHRPNEKALILHLSER